MNTKQTSKTVSGIAPENKLDETLRALLKVSASCPEQYWLDDPRPEKERLAIVTGLARDARYEAENLKGKADAYRKALEWIGDKLRAEGSADSQDATQIIWHIESAISRAQRDFS